MSEQSGAVEALREMAEDLLDKAELMEIGEVPQETGPQALRAVAAQIKAGLPPAITHWVILKATGAGICIGLLIATIENRVMS